ncbi:hypothetical protein QBC44DRAFT_384344 [Cladorrhinum sp. PSN332]|nr:hypothetical protein QBC44DRAFT_384344 [Cladorrhinum sp. PSN332]
MSTFSFLGGTGTVKIKQEPGVPIKREPSSSTGFDMSSIPAAPRAVKVKKEDAKGGFGGQLDMSSIPMAPTKSEDSKSSLHDIPEFRRKKRRRHFSSGWTTVRSYGWEFRAHYHQRRSEVEITTLMGSTLAFDSPDIGDCERDIFRRLHKANFRINPVAAFGTLCGFKYGRYGRIEIDYSRVDPFTVTTQNGQTSVKVWIPVQPVGQETRTSPPLFPETESKPSVTPADLDALTVTRPSYLTPVPEESKPVARQPTATTSTPQAARNIFGQPEQLHQFSSPPHNKNPEASLASQQSLTPLEQPSMTTQQPSATVQQTLQANQEIAMLHRKEAIARQKAAMLRQRVSLLKRENSITSTSAAPEERVPAPVPTGDSKTQELSAASSTVQAAIQPGGQAQEVPCSFSSVRTSSLASTFNSGNTLGFAQAQGTRGFSFMASYKFVPNQFGSLVDTTETPAPVLAGNTNIPPSNNGRLSATASPEASTGSIRWNFHPMFGGRRS